MSFFREHVKSKFLRTAVLQELQITLSVGLYLTLSPTSEGKLMMSNTIQFCAALLSSKKKEKTTTSGSYEKTVNLFRRS